jgi:hypothetical protein
MGTGSYTATIEVAKPPREAFDRITAITKWWVSPASDFEGRSTKLGDEFVIRHGDVHYSRHKLIEVVPDKKLVWLITDSKLRWLEKDPHEWTDTRLAFELTPRGDTTVIRFTHEGLVAGKECYEKVAQSWNKVIKEWLYDFITHGTARSPPPGVV